MPNYIQKIDVIALHQRFDLIQEFKPGINIFHGKNGSGKTTLLHILANLLNAKYARFAFLDFKSINVTFDDDSKITIRRYGKNNSYISVNSEDFSAVEAQIVEERYNRSQEKNDPITKEFLQHFKNSKISIPTAYFPAFRTMIEAWSSTVLKSRQPESLRQEELFGIGSYRRRLSDKSSATVLARQLFGNFVPSLNYPSPLEIEEKIRYEYKNAFFTMAEVDQKLLSEAFLKIFAVLSKGDNQIREKPEHVLAEIRTLINQLEHMPLGGSDQLNRIYSKLLSEVDTPIAESEYLEGIGSSILEIYRQCLNERAKVQVEAFKEIKRYLDAINDFLEEKEICIIPQNVNSNKPFMNTKFDDDTTHSLQVLSSGERQIITMIYAASQMNSQRIVLIDEPELSLHVDWQRLLLKKLSEQIRERQIIVCTHSPVIGADYRGRLMELNLKKQKLLIYLMFIHIMKRRMRNGNGE